MSAAAFMYGGLHLLAWNAAFHAPIYGLLWKVSGITTANLGIIPLLAGLILLISRGSIRYTTPRRCTPYRVVLVLLCLLTYSFTLLYVLARVYLVVESFLDLAYVPESVLVTPNIVLYIPHLG
jgi:hypothetical protein